MEENPASNQKSAPRYRSAAQPKRVASVYDAVAGRIGSSGFLPAEQLGQSNALPCTPEEVLLRRVSAPDQIPYDYYDAAMKLEQFRKLPDSDLLKAIHTYASDYFSTKIQDAGAVNFRSFDETALLALGILLEEALHEPLGRTGDMVLTQSEASYYEPVESKMAKHQIVGRVVPRKLHTTTTTEDISHDDDSEQEESPRKRQK